jgi:hypothetical protein
MIEHDEQTKAVPPIPALLDTIDKQTALITEAVHGLADQLDKVLRPADPESATVARDGQEMRGGSNLATRLGQISSHLGDLGVYVNRLMARLEL